MNMREKVIEILCEVNNKIKNNLEVDLLASGIVDSYEIVNIVVEIEEALDIEIDPELVIPENFQTVDAIVKLVESIVGE